MPSFDIVSEITIFEVKNALENAQRALAGRWDFKNVIATMTFNEKDQQIILTSESEFQVDQLLDILTTAMIKREIESGCLSISDGYVHSGKTYSKTIELKQGVSKETAKKIVKLLKDAKLKVQSQIQGDEVRVSGKSRDDLQRAIALVKNTALDQPLQFKNFRD